MLARFESLLVKQLIIPHSKELDEKESADVATFEAIEQKSLGLVMPWVEGYDGEGQSLALPSSFATRP
jgi:hypothetical protein